MQQNDVDHVLMNLRVDATVVKEQMHIRWAAETGLVDAIEPVVAAYRQLRGLQVATVHLLPRQLLTTTSVLYFWRISAYQMLSIWHSVWYR